MYIDVYIYIYIYIYIIYTYIYIYIYILLLYRLSVPLFISPGKPYITSKVSINALKSREPPEPVVVLRLLPGGAAGSPNVTFSNTSAPACQKWYIFPMNFAYYDMSFSESCWRPHSSYIFDMASTLPKSCGTPKLTKISWNQLLHVFPMLFQCFYASATRRQLREVTNKLDALFWHYALEGVHVHENTLCVTFGAPRFRTHFRILTRCFEYAAFHLLSRTHVRRTTLCVTFGARRRSIPSGLLDRLLGHSDHQGRPRAPEWFRRATVWAASAAQGCHPNLISSRPQRHPDLQSGI